VVAAQGAALAAFGVTHPNRLQGAALGLQGVDGVLPQEFDAELDTALRQLLGKQAGVAAFVGGGVGAAHHVRGIGAKGGFDLQQFRTADHLPVDAIARHQGGSIGGGVESLGIEVEMRNAFFQPVVADAGGDYQLLERRMAVRAQGHQLLHVALEGRVIALRHKGHGPAVLLPAGAPGNWGRNSSGASLLNIHLRAFKGASRFAQGSQ